eukprot:763252-Hanusia_phi.AAC.9
MAKMKETKKDFDVEDEVVRDSDDIWAKEDDIPKQFKQSELEKMNDNKWISPRLNGIQQETDDGVLEKGIAVVDGVKLDAVLLDLIEASRFDFNGNPSTITERKEWIVLESVALIAMTR